MNEIEILKKKKGISRRRYLFPYVSNFIVRLELRTSSNQSLTSFVTRELSEVLDETASQIFCFFFPLCKRQS